MSRRWELSRSSAVSVALNSQRRVSSVSDQNIAETLSREILKRYSSRERDAQLYCVVGGQARRSTWRTTLRRSTATPSTARARACPRPCRRKERLVREMLSRWRVERRFGEPPPSPPSPPPQTERHARTAEPVLMYVSKGAVREGARKRGFLSMSLRFPAARFPRRRCRARALRCSRFVSST